LEGQTATDVCVPTRGADTFLGWFRDAQSLYPWDFTAPILSDTTIYAGWLPVGWHRIVFETGDGSFVPAAQVQDGRILTPPRAPSMPAGTHKAFEGWFVDDPPTTPFDFTLPVTASRTLYAKWGCMRGYHAVDDACVMDVCQPGEDYLEGTGCVPGCPYLALGKARAARWRVRRSTAKAARKAPTLLRADSPRTALNNVIGSVALTEASLSHILNAEGEKIQHFLFKPLPAIRARRVRTKRPSRVQRLIDMGNSANQLVRRVKWLELMLFKKLYVSVNAWPEALLNVQVRKVDDLGDPVPGAVFSFEGQGLKFDVTSNVDGWIICPCIPPGVYTAREILTPMGYIGDGQTHTVAVLPDGRLRLDGRLDGQLVNVRE
jgi:uncharacterized repeat protein (TIGR02543 family)